MSGFGVEVMGADAHRLHILSHSLRCGEADSPIGHLNLVFAGLSGRGNVLAACKRGRADAAGIGKQLFLLLQRQQMPLIQHSNAVAKMIGLIPAVGDQQNRTAKPRQQLLQLQLQLVP